MRSSILCVIALAGALVPCPAWGLTTGAVRGIVVDVAGAPLPGVIVRLTSAHLGIDTQLGASDSAGRFQALSLPAGDDYVLKASLKGYSSVAAPDIEVVAGQVTSLALTLPPESSLRESVRVRGTTNPVDLEERGLTTRYSSEFIDNLPILGRNYQDVLALAPGVSDVDGDGNPNIHGARDTDVGTLVDGINTTDPLTGKLGAQLNIESIQEIEVKTAGATAEFGRAQGGFANIITRSGGNDFEGVFKFYWRGSLLDGDGAGADAPELHGGVGAVGLSDLTFNDYLPFLSLSGPIVKDKAWYFVTLEYIRKEEPVNAVSQAFVTGLRETRAFAKGTWQVSENHRVSLILNYDPQEFLNQGLNSLTREETGYTIKAGGPLISLRDTSILGPSVALESAVSYFDGKPGVEPNLGIDTNGDGTLFYDRNDDGFLAANERDPGEDYDHDGAFDTWEDTLMRNGQLDQVERPYCFIDGFWRPSPMYQCTGPHSFLLDEDGPRPQNLLPLWPSGDGDRRLTTPGGCEGVNREDSDCDGIPDFKNEDLNGNGLLDPGEDIDGDRRLDLGTEDRNTNRRLDDTPFPTTLYPYGRLQPIPADREYNIDLRAGVISGPYYRTFDDQRARGTLRQDLSVFVADFHGAHDIKTGYTLEREHFTRAAEVNDVLAIDDPGWRTGIRLDEVQHPELHYDCNPYEEPCHDPGLGRITAILPIAHQADQEADGQSAGVYAQDTWRPLPNLSLSLGVRFDRETATSDGYTFFDPRAERAHADRLTALAGGEATAGDDLIAGNNDGILSLGIPGDPLFAPIVGDTITSLRRRAAASFTLHRAGKQFGSAALEQLYPDVFPNGEFDPVKAAELGVQVQQPETFRVTNNNLSPRLGISWDPRADGRSKAFASWGRYYDRLFLSTIVGEQGVETIQRYYVLDRDGIDPISDPVSGRFIRGIPNHNIGTRLSNSPPTVTQVDRGLATPYSDEWTIGFEHEIAPETALSLRYVQRRYRDQLQDVDLNHETRVDPNTGELADLLGRVVVVEDDPPSGEPVRQRQPDGRPDLFVQNVFFNQILRVGNYNAARYNGFEVELRRRLSRRWQLQGSYTYSRAQGAAEDFQSRLGNDPSTLESEFGYLDFDQRHVVKLNAAFFLPGDWQVGTSAAWASGLPYSIVSRFFALDNVDYQQFRTRYGYTALEDNALRFQSVNRNSERNGSTFDLNASARKSFVIGRTTWGISLEVFNLLNRDELRIYSYEPSRTNGFDSESNALLSGPFQLDAERRFGRRFQIGFQFEF